MSGRTFALRRWRSALRRVIVPRRFRLDRWRAWRKPLALLRTKRRGERSRRAGAACRAWPVALCSRLVGAGTVCGSSHSGAYGSRRPSRSRQRRTRAARAHAAPTHDQSASACCSKKKTARRCAEPPGVPGSTCHAWRATAGRRARSLGTAIPVVTIQQRRERRQAANATAQGACRVRVFALHYARPGSRPHGWPAMRCQYNQWFVVNFSPAFSRQYRVRDAAPALGVVSK